MLLYFIRVRASCLILAIIISSLFTVAAKGQERDWISMWAFQGRSEDSIRNRLTSDFQLQLVILDRVCELEPPQRKKIELAGRLEVNRFFRDVGRVRKKLSEMDLDNNDVQQAWTVVSPIATKIQNGLFNDGSLFQKVVHAALTESQRRSYEQELENSRRRRWRKITRINVAEIEESMPLLESQRTELLALLDQQEIPLTFTRQMDGYAGYYKLIKIDEADLAELLDEEQMKVIAQFRQRFRGFGMMFQ